MEAASLKPLNPTFLELESAIYYQYVGQGSGDDNTDFIRREVNPDELADSVVRDFTTSSIEYSDVGAPGLFWVPGEFDVDNQEHKDRIKSAYVSQEKWFERLVSLADADWSRLQDPRHVSDLQRFAARHFNLDRDWAIEPSKDTIVCDMCATSVKAYAVLCPNCGYVLNEEKFEANRHRFSGSGRVNPALQLNPNA